MLAPKNIAVSLVSVASTTGVLAQFVQDPTFGLDEKEDTTIIDGPINLVDVENDDKDVEIGEDQTSDCTSKWGCGNNNDNSQLEVV